MIYAEVRFSLLRLLFSQSCRLCVTLLRSGVSEFHGIELGTRATYHYLFRALSDEYESSDKALHDAAITLNRTWQNKSPYGPASEPLARV